METCILVIYHLIVLFVNICNDTSIKSAIRLSEYTSKGNRIKTCTQQKDNQENETLKKSILDYYIRNVIYHFQMSQSNGYDKTPKLPMTK